MSAQWYLLGLQLKVKTGTLDRFRAQFSDPRDLLMEMLKTWLTTSDNTTWKTLTDALSSRSVGASQLAGVLEKKYRVVERAEVDRDVSASGSDPETCVTSTPNSVNRAVPASDSDSKAFVTPPPDSVVEQPTSLADMQDLESKFFCLHET